MIPIQQLHAFSDELEKLSGEKPLTAVIVKGNPKYVQGRDKKRADSFYRQIQRHLERKGYNVAMDPGLPYTSPPKADLWIGHSRGVDRLRFAPKGTRTIGLGTAQPENADFILNHPKDIPEVGRNPNRYHYVFTREMMSKISMAAKDIPINPKSARRDF